MKNILILSCFAAIVMRVLCFFVGYEGYRILIVTLLIGGGKYSCRYDGHCYDFAVWGFH